MNLYSYCIIVGFCLGYIFYYMLQHLFKEIIKYNSYKCSKCKGKLKEIGYVPVDTVFYDKFEFKKLYECDKCFEHSFKPSDKK